MGELVRRKLKKFGSGLGTPDDGMPYVVVGRNPVLEALRAGRPLNRVLLAKNVERHSAVAEIIHLAKTCGIPVEYVERQAIDRQSDTPINQGVAAIAAAREYTDLDDLLSIPLKKKEHAFFVVLDGLEDPHNVGAILRTAEATGVHGVILRQHRAAGLTAAVEKSSAGAIEYVPVAQVTNVSRTIEAMKKDNVWVVGIDRSGKTIYTGIDYRPPTALVVGSEGGGISELVRKHSDFVVSIPMKGKIGSLNASVAAAVVMYEVVRQRDSATHSSP